ncbi:sigma-70 family RNA polymerase sigma factor [Pseudomonas sp. SLFW]|uniref:sigma-70 family RNA polymerase sigma factor n=1 Tax=Pseudomonas sp. SLFW TaxID=2683259 RepID=UPI0014127B54|nr:sigma-70 family RNA polymerase sigma factor [Pseudomonas sp. SLFW]NBB11901.1 sigma-70 family RNA polymerase sigma factor [Pseudomonas sp. SLFW]
MPVSGSSSHPHQGVATLYGAHHGWLVNWLRGRLGCSHQAADMAQDTFMRVLLADRNQPITHELIEPRHFLVTIARRVMVDSFRRRSVEEAYLHVLAEQPERYAVSPEERLMLLETLHALDAMLSGLGKRVKEAFLLSQLQGLGYKDIAEQLAVSVSSVTKYIARATEHCLLFQLEHGA